MNSLVPKLPVIALIGAMDEEIRMYLDRADIHNQRIWNGFTFYEGEWLHHPVVIVKSGVGKILAATICQHLLHDYSVNACILTGAAGALHPDVEIGDVIVSSDCVQHDMKAEGLGFARGHIPYTDFRFFKANQTLLDVAAATKIPHHRVLSGRILTGDQFIVAKDAEDMLNLRDELKGDAIDMESAAIGLVCEINQVPFVVIKTITDQANSQAIVDFNDNLPIIVQNSFSVVKSILQTLSLTFGNL